MLYLRMLFVMTITLYTSRVVLYELGVVDFGIYNVVGGVVAMLGFLSAAMSNTIQRFLSFEIGRRDSLRLNEIFCISLSVYVFLSVVIFILLEILGVYYLNNFLNIPQNRIPAANWVLQCTILSTCSAILQSPFNAMIISKEDMSVFAYISIFEVLLKLGIAFSLSIGGYDKLILYSILIAVSNISIMLIYRYYCVKNYKESNFKFIREKSTYKKILSFAGWNILSEFAWVACNQGVNLILNSFFGPVVNAARGIASQVSGSVDRFTTNFTTAVNPQLIKSYANNEISEMRILFCRSTKFTFFIMIILSVPIVIEMDFILHLWLKEVPNYTKEFCQLIIISSTVQCLSNYTAQIIRAEGNIMKYQIIGSIIIISIFPISWFVLYMGYSPLSVMWVNIGIMIALTVIRLTLIKNIIEMSYSYYIKNVLLPCILTTLGSLLFPLTIKMVMPNMMYKNLITIAISIVSVLISCFILGLKRGERNYFLSLARDKVKSFSLNR